MHSLQTPPRGDNIGTAGSFLEKEVSTMFTAGEPWLDLTRFRMAIIGRSAALSALRFFDPSKSWG